MPHSPNLPPRSQYPSYAHSSAASAFSRRKRRKNSRSRVLRSRIKRVLVVIGSVGLVWVNPTASAGSVREAVTVHPLSQGNVGVEGQGKGSAAGNFIEVRAAGPVGKEANRNLPRDRIDGQGVDSGAAVGGDGESDHWRGVVWYELIVADQRVAGSRQRDTWPGATSTCPPRPAHFASMRALPLWSRAAYPAVASIMTRRAMA